jgi:kynurenine formamidase
MKFKLVDLSHPWAWNTPPWVGYESHKVYYERRLPTNGIVALRIETSVHDGTHIDAPLHYAPAGRDMASVPLEQLCAEGVIVDVSDKVGEWDLIEPEHLTAKMEIRKGDIVVVHTGWHHYYTHGDRPDETKYFCRHPGGSVRLAEWVVMMDLKWIGFDTGSADHPMNTVIRDRRPDLAQEYERKIGKTIKEMFKEEDLFIMHKVPFAKNIPHAENMGGDIEKVVNRRCMIGAFPWKFVGGCASICRIVAFIED